MRKVSNVRGLCEVLNLKDARDLPRTLPEDLEIVEMIQPGVEMSRVELDGAKVVLFAGDFKILKEETAKNLVIWLQTKGSDKFACVRSLFESVREHLDYMRRIGESREFYEAQCLDRYGEESPWMDLKKFGGTDVLSLPVLRGAISDEDRQAFVAIRAEYETAFDAAIAAAAPSDLNGYFAAVKEFTTKCRDEKRRIPFLKMTAVFRSFGKDSFGETKNFYIVVSRTDLGMIEQIHAEMEPPREIKSHELYSAWLAARWLLQTKQEAERFLSSDAGAATAKMFAAAFAAATAAAEETSREKRGRNFRRDNRGRDRNRDGRGKGRGGYEHDSRHANDEE